MEQSTNLHQLAEERSLEYHREIARRLPGDPRIIAEARGCIDRWLAQGTLHPEYARQWLLILDQPLDQLVEAIVDPSERGRQLRQSTPFAGALDPQTRWRIHREIGQRWGIS